MSQVSIPISFDWSHIAQDSPYLPCAFEFVQDGLGYTSSLCNERDLDDFALDELELHVSGQQLCMGLRDFAIERFGILAPVVLRHWGVHRTEDFGAIVFRLVDMEILRTSPQDTEDDFRSVFNFDEAFHQQELTDLIGSSQ